MRALRVKNESSGKESKGFVMMRDRFVERGGIGQWDLQRERKGAGIRIMDFLNGEGMMHFRVTYASHMPIFCTVLL